MKHKQDYTFSRVPRAEIPRSMFNRSHQHKTTFSAGYLIPFYVDEALPGDTFKVKAALFGRLATPIVPVMDNMYLDVFFFAIPNRLVWDNWQKFCGEQLNPGDSTDYLVPQISSGSGFAEQSVYDYMGMPTKVANVSVSALFLRAYNLVYNEWFRDENLVNRAVVSKGDGPDNGGDYVLRRRGKRHDYFTSALPWPQKGPGVTLPLSGFADVISEGAGVSGAPIFSGVTSGKYGTLAGASAGYTNTPTPREPVMIKRDSGTSGTDDDVLTWVDPKLKADLGTTAAVTINTMREAFQIQKLLERDARGGTRYTEIVRSHFGVISPDARLQRPEYLGGGSVPVVIHPVAKTADTANGPLGQLAGYGTVGSNRVGFNKSFVEHSIILGIVMARADLTYQQGLPRMFSRRTRYDFYWPALAHLGEQSIKMKEIYAAGTSADDTVFGYQERWAEYRYFPSKITGLFRSNAAQPLHIWHLAQNFGSAPGLNQQFIEENPPVDRVVAVPNPYPHFLFDSFIQIQAARPMPVYSVPGLIDHF